MRAPFAAKLMRAIQRSMRKKREKGRENLYSDVSSTLDIQYAGDKNKRHRLDVYYKNKTEIAPVIIVVHGGGYVSCEKEINTFQARYFATRGFKVVNADYTLQPEAGFAEEMQELACVVNWISDHKNEYGFDTERVYLTGDSAGGHLVLLYGAVCGNERLQKYFGFEKPELSIKAICATCPAIDLEDVTKGGKPSRENSMAILGQIMFPKGFDKELLDNVSIPKLLPESELPPIMAITTPTDTGLYKYTVRLKDEMTKNGKDFTYKEYVGRANKLEHVFNVLFPEYEESIEANEDMINFFLAH